MIKAPEIYNNSKCVYTYTMASKYINKYDQSDLY